MNGGIFPQKPAPIQGIYLQHWNLISSYCTSIAMAALVQQMAPAYKTIAPINKQQTPENRGLLF
jgi:hypothetical protein